MHDDVVLHGKDVEAVKDTGTEVTEAQPETTPAVDATKGAIESRYLQFCFPLLVREWT